jgi:zinc protease
MTTPPRRLRVSGALALLAAGTFAVGLVRTWAQAQPSASARLTAGLRETVLPNGLRVLTKEVHAAPVVSFSVWYRVGSRNEHTGITGVSHLLEHMMFKGTKQYRPGEIPRLLFLNGAGFNASTHWDWTNYYETLSSDRLELAMKVEADRMVNSRIDKADLDSEMTVVRSELEGGENNPGRLLWREVVATAFIAHPYQWPVIGWRSDVENVPRDEIYRYYKTHYGPNTATIVIVGDFDTARALALVRRHFGALKPIPAPERIYTAEPPQRGERRVTVRRPGALPIVMAAYKIPQAASPESYALEVLAMVLGEGRTSRLHQALVEKGLASSAGASNPALRDPFLFEVTATARPGVSADQLEAALLAEVDHVREAPITAEELRRAQSRVEADFVFQTDSVTSQARQIGYWAMVADWRYLTTFLDGVRALTPEAIQEVAEKYLVPDGRTVGHFIPATGGGPAAPPPREASARVEPPKRGDRLLPLPAPSKAPPATRQVTRFTLPNGIRVVVQDNPANPTFALRASLPAGSVVEPEAKLGVAGFTAGMLTRGTERQTMLQFATALEDVGASLGASADGLNTSISGGAQAKDFDLLMDLFVDMLRRPAFPPADLERLRGEHLAGLAQAKESPDRLAERAFQRAVYPPGHRLRPHTVEEEQAAATAITREDLVDFHRRQYGPDKLIVVVTGDVRPERVRAALESRLGDWARNPAAEPLSQLDLPLQAAPEKVLIRVPDKAQTAIRWGHAGGLRRSDPDFYATQVLSLILGGGGLTSRLSTAIRDERGLAYSVGGFFDANLYPGAFQVGMGTNPANAAKAIAVLEQEVRRIREQGITKRELDEALAYLTGRFPLRLETNAGLADILWAMEFFQLGDDYIDRYADYYRAVTVTQVNEAAKAHLHPDQATLAVAGTLPE